MILAAGRATVRRNRTRLTVRLRQFETSLGCEPQASGVLEIPAQASQPLAAGRVVALPFLGGNLGGGDLAEAVGLEEGDDALRRGAGEGVAQPRLRGALEREADQVPADAATDVARECVERGDLARVAAREQRADPGEVAAFDEG